MTAWIYGTLAIVSFFLSMYVYIRIQDHVKNPGREPILLYFVAFFRPKVIFKDSGYGLLLLWLFLVLVFLACGTLALFSL